MNSKKVKVMADDGMKPCPYCHKKFKRLCKHRCLSKPDDVAHVTDSTKELSLSDVTDDDDDGGTADAIKGLSLSDVDADDGKTPCPYCHVRFKRIKQHRCEFKRNYESTPCPYCHEKFLCLDLHQPKCPYEPSILHKSKFKEILKLVRLHKEHKHQILKMNDLMENILADLNNCSDLRWKKLNSGSYYSKVKVSKPNEFDYMLRPSKLQCRIEQSPLNPCYCRVFITNKHQLPPDVQEMLLPHDELTPSTFKEYVFKVFDLFLENSRNRRLERIEEDKIITSPAYTIQYKYGKTISDIDLVPCLKVQGLPDFCMEWDTKKLTNEEKEKGHIYVVPKRLIADGEELELWRISHSYFEKEIILHKCLTNEKQIIRILKAILGEVKDETSKLCSYHVVTHCLYFFEKAAEEAANAAEAAAEAAEERDFQEYTMRAVESLVCKLKSKDLRHFFIRKHNLLQDVDDKECKDFIEKLNFYITEWTE